MDKKIVFWTCNEDAEVLTCDSSDDAVEEHLDQMEVESLKDFPETLKVFGYSRASVDKERFKKVVLEYAGEYLGENYDGEDGHETNSAIEDACEKFVSVYLDNYTPWNCEQVESKEVNTITWITENRADWLEELK